jgi:RNA polymerase sigma-70 factor, ECF subfamily
MKRNRARGSHLEVVDGGRASAQDRHPTDEDIIRAVEHGDPRVADQLYDRLLSVVDRTLVRVMGRREVDHDDLVQAAFEQIVLTITKGRFARACSLDAWASTLSSRIAFNALRARTRERRVVDRRTELDDATRIRSTGRDVEREAGVRQQLERLRQHLSRMTEARATTLFLHDGLGYDLAEIAILTDVSISAAQSRLVRGRRELKQRIEADASTQEDER